MEELIIEYKQTGNCTVDVDKVVNGWNDKFSISQYGDKYTLVESIELFQEECHKVDISNEQAFEIIEKAKLLPIQSSLFVNCKTWRTESNIISEQSRITSILKQNDNPHKIRIIKKVIRELDCALEAKK